MPLLVIVWPLWVFLIPSLLSLANNLSISGEEGHTWDEGHVRVCCKAEPWAELSRWYSQDCHCFSPDANDHFKPHPSAHSINMTISLQPGCICVLFPRTCYFLHTHIPGLALSVVPKCPTFSKVNIFTLHTMLGPPYLFKVWVGLKIDHQGPWESSCSRAEKASERHVLDYLKMLRNLKKSVQYWNILHLVDTFILRVLKTYPFCQSQIVYYARFIKLACFDLTYCHFFNVEPFSRVLEAFWLERNLS